MLTFKQYIAEEKRYHILKTAHWQQSLQKGHLDPEKYEGKKIWTSKHPSSHFEKEFPGSSLGKDETELEISMPKKWLRGDSTHTNDRTTNRPIPTSRIKVIR